MVDNRPPTIDPVAARHWERVAPAASPWLHEEVARRMADRLQWIRLAPQAWTDWEPLRGGIEGHALVQGRYPKAASFALEPDQRRLDAARRALVPPWWRRWTAPSTRVVAEVPDGSVQMLWANMHLHMHADPAALIAQWHRALAVDGFLMFSCLGPDTLRELRALYAALDWPPCAHEFTDMHDWGDMLVHAGFAEPVMDMERITLSWGSADALLSELRGLGANLHPERFPGLRGRGFRRQLSQALEARLRQDDGRLALTFEIVYGHALKPVPRVRMGAESAVSLQDMQQLLQAGRKGGA